MTKRWISLLLAAVLLLTLAACGKQKDTDQSTDKDKNSVSENKVTTTTAVPTSTTSAFPIYYVTGNPLNVRSSPQVTSDNWVGSLPYGTPVEILGTEGNWYRISFKGMRAYISADYVSPEPPAEAAS